MLILIIAEVDIILCFIDKRLLQLGNFSFIFCNQQFFFQVSNIFFYKPPQN